MAPVQQSQQPQVIQQSPAPVVAPQPGQKASKKKSKKDDSSSSSSDDEDKKKKKGFLAKLNKNKKNKKK